MAHPLPLTGERTLPGIAEERYWFARHEAAYAWVARVLALPPQARVVEAGSGEGYGAALLRRGGVGDVVALEYDAATCTHAAAAYPGVPVVRANLAALPVRRGSVDAVVSLQVVEHLWDLRGFLAACRDVLREAGVLVLSTPNRLTFSPGLDRGERPTNPFHVEEFDAAQLADLVTRAGFRDVEVHGLHHGPRLTGWESEHGSLVAAQIDALVAGTWSDDLHRTVASVTAGDFDVHDRDVASSLDLLLLARTGTAA